MPGGDRPPGKEAEMRRRRILLLPVVLALGVLSAACGTSGADNDGVASAGNGGSAKNAGDGKKKTDPQQAGLDFARCMREHGIDMPDPKADGGGMVMIGPGAGDGSVSAAPAPPAGFQEADKACRHHLEGLIADGGGALDLKEQDRALKFAKCMRENGVNMPDPDFSNGRVQIAIGEGFQPESETFKAAQKACGSLFGPGDGRAPSPGVGARS